MITNINKNLHVSGIYKINFDNGKIYIGQSKEIYLRALDHNCKNRQVCDKALKNHQATIEVLEIVTDFELLDSLEEKWIKHFDATNKNIGYNIISEGNVANKRGANHVNAAFSQSEIEIIYDLLKNHTELSLVDIAKRYQVNPETIRRICIGHNYHNPNLIYPLRTYQNHDSQRKDSMEDYFDSEEKLIALKEDLLKRWDLHIETDLVAKYNIPLGILRKINQGEMFQQYGDYTYPIRSINFARNKHNLTFADIENILNLLKNTNETMTSIGKRYGMGRAAIAKINNGDTHPIPNYDYPARKTK